MLRLERRLSITASISSRLRGFGKKGRKGRTSVLGGKYDQQHWPSHLRGERSKLARNPDWSSAILSPRIVDRAFKNMTTRHAVHGNNYPGRFIDAIRMESEVTHRVQKDVHAVMHERPKTDYPAREYDPDVRRQMDDHFDNWLTTDPNHHNVRNVDVRSPLTRQAIKEQDRAWKKVMIYERDNDYKYIVEPVEKSGLANLSYWHQHITKTALVEEELPTRLVDTENAAFVANVRKVERTVKLVHSAIAGQKAHQQNIAIGDSARAWSMRSHRDKLATDLFQATRRLVDNDELDEAVVDHLPEVLHFWMRGYSTTEPGEHKKDYVQSEPTKFQSVLRPATQYRINGPLTALLPRDECVERTEQRVISLSESHNVNLTLRNVPWFDYDPEVLFIYKQKWRNYIKPGFDINVGNIFTNYDLARRNDPYYQREQVVTSPDTHLFPHTQCTGMPTNFNPGWFGPQPVEHGVCMKAHKVPDSFNSHSIMAGFTWTAGLAHYQGFFQDDDLTTPLCTQLINTDGYRIQFAFYQLNTLAIDPENDGYNRIANYCFVSPVFAFENDTDQGPIAQWLTAFAMNGSKKNEPTIDLQAPLCRAQMAEFPDLAMQMENLRF